MSNTCPPDSQDSKADGDHFDPRERREFAAGNGSQLVAELQTDKAVRPLRKRLRSLASAASDLQYNSLGAEAGESKQVVENLFWINQGGPGRKVQRPDRKFVSAVLCLHLL